MNSPEPTSPNSQPAVDTDGEKDAELVELGQRIRELRHAAGLTQEALAESAGFHWSYVGQIERGERNPTYKNLLRVAHGLSVRPGVLMQRSPGR